MRRFVSVWLPHWPIERLARMSPGAVPGEAPLAHVQAKWEPVRRENVLETKKRARIHDSTRDEPALALVEAVHGRLTLTAVNRGARCEGLTPGLALADARAAVPALATLLAEPAADLAALRRLALWMSRYGVRVTLERPATGDPRKSKARQLRAAIDAPDGIGIEITGVAHLFGGEKALLADLVRRLSGFGLTVRPGLADTPGAAFAVARAITSGKLGDRIVPLGETAARLAPLPVAALRLAPETVMLLHRLGLKTIGQLAAVPRPNLERRFDSRDVTAAVLTRLDQALGVAKEPARSLTPPARYSVRQSFAEPLISSEGVMAALDDLTAGLADTLAKAEAAARRLVLALYRSDGSLVRIPAGLSRPSREAAHFHRLLAGKLAAVDLGFGVDLMTLAAPATENLEAAQATLADLASSRAGDVALLIDRLASRLGMDRVLRLAPHASHLPEQAEVLVPALEHVQAKWEPVRRENVLQANNLEHFPTKWIPVGRKKVLKTNNLERRSDSIRSNSALDQLSDQQGSENALDPPPPKRGARPPFLLPHPEPVAVVAEIPDGPPARLEWRRRRCRIVKAEGPERIAPEWWQPLLALARQDEIEARPKRRARTRDYYTIEDEAGRRYWVFREGLYGREESEAPPAWYLHGLFA